jgi:hypothetical protein
MIVIVAKSIGNSNFEPWSNMYKLPESSSGGERLIVNWFEVEPFLQKWQPTLLLPISFHCRLQQI